MLTGQVGLTGAGWALLTGQALVVILLGAIVRWAVGPFMPWQALGVAAASSLPALAVRAALGAPAGTLGVVFQSLLTLGAFGLTFLSLRTLCRAGSPRGG